MERQHTRAFPMAMEANELPRNFQLHWKDTKGLFQFARSRKRTEYSGTFFFGGGGRGGEGAVAASVRNGCHGGTDADIGGN